MGDPSLNGGSPIEILDVISGFGVALSSTILGVFLRVLMMQLRPDFITKEREIRVEINKSFGNFRKNMGEMLDQMKTFATESVQKASERDEHIRKVTEVHFQHHQSALKESTKALSETMKTAFSATMKDIIKEISDANKENQARIKSTLDDLVALKDRLNEYDLETFEQISTRRKMLMEQIEEHQKKIIAQKEATELQIKSTHRAAEALTSRVIPALDDFKKRLDALPADNNLLAPSPYAQKPRLRMLSFIRLFRVWK